MMNMSDHDIESVQVIHQEKLNKEDLKWLREK